MQKIKLLFRGPVLTSSGYGVHARQILNAILDSDRFDVSVCSVKWGETSYFYDDEKFLSRVKPLIAKYEQEKSHAKYALSVQVSIPNEFQKLAQYNIGVTAGIEVNAVSSQWLLKCNQEIDLLVVPSFHSKQVFEQTQYKANTGQVLKLEKPIFAIAEGFDDKIFNTKDAVADSDLLSDVKQEFNFLHVGLGLERNPGEDRKNISNLIKWFCEQFKGNESVGLVLKTSVVNNSLMDFKLTEKRISDIKNSTGCGQYPKIHLIHGRLTEQEMAALYKHEKIKAFVTLTHGEGFGLPLLEAAACGLPILATDWSGHTDFLQKDGKKLFIPLEYDLAEVPDSVVWQGVIEKGTAWANVKEKDVKNKFFKISKSYETPKKWAVELADHVFERYRLDVVQQQFIKLLNSFLDATLTNGSQVVGKESFVESYKKSVFDEQDFGKKILFTMPMSAGDVYMSTGIVSSLKEKYPDHKIFFATNKQYRSILKNNPDIHKVIDWHEWMMDISLCEKIFDDVYTPNLNVQMNFSNWVHGGKGRQIAEEMAVACNVELSLPKIFLDENVKFDLPEKFVVFNPGAGTGQWEARNYLHWQEVVDNLLMNDVVVVQVGTADEPAYKGVLDLRGKTETYNQLAYVISKASVVFGIDSLAMHLAAGLGVQYVSLFGSSYAASTGPSIKQTVKKSPFNVLLETKNRYTCDRACYKYTCSVNKDVPCINELEPSSVFYHVISAYQEGIPVTKKYVEYRPKLSGYIHILNPRKNNYPYKESIQSMLGFCDEVVVVDGGSTDGSVEELKALNDEKLQIFTREWDWSEPGMDGMQKAYARAMCTGDFLWQQDADEVVSEEDYDKIRNIVKTFPKSYDLMHLPVIELWGDEKTVRTDRHSWKWRLSRNVFNITHGIVKHARVEDPETGKIYAKKGMSDGCEYVDIMTGEYIHHKGFYTQEIEQLRHENPDGYGIMMNKLFKQLPCVYHYSWMDLKRKIMNFRDFWDDCWNNLYKGSEKEQRFFKGRQMKDVSDDEIAAEAERIRPQGGEHGFAKTFVLEKKNPEVMNEWIKRAKC